MLFLKDLAYLKDIAVNATYILSGEESPFVSSYKDNLKIDAETIFSEFKILSKGMDCAIIEGGNSISSPVAQNMTELDLVRMLNVPLVLVINPKKSPIHSVISALKYVSSEGVNLKGIILNQYDSESENLEEKYFSQIVNEFSNIKVLGSIPDYGDISHITPETLISNTINNTNIEEIFGLKIAKLNRGI